MTDSDADMKINYPETDPDDNSTGSIIGLTGKDKFCFND
jgi:hypothetical protein